MLWLIGIVLVILFLFGCEPERVDSPQPNVVKIGVIYSLTGCNAPEGEELKAGVQLASEIIDKPFDLPMPMASSGGLPAHQNAKVKIVFADARSEPRQAAAGAEHLVKNEGVAALMGCYNSSLTASASEQAEMMKVPFLNAASTSPVLTDRGFSWFFRTTPDDRIFGLNFFSFLSDLIEKDRIQIPKRIVLVYENRLWGTSVSRLARQLAKRHGYIIVGDIPYDHNDQSFEKEIEKVKKCLPAIVLQASYAEDAILFMKGYKDRQINPVAILAMDAGFISPAFSGQLGSDAEYILSREVWALNIGRKKPIVDKVNNLFKKRYGRDMNGNSARAFTGLMVLADAINRAQSTEAHQIRKAILETDLKGDQIIMPWDGVKFDPKTGQNISGKGIIVQMLDGQFRTVWPWNLAERPVTWPMPVWSERGPEK